MSNLSFVEFIKIGKKHVVNLLFGWKMTKNCFFSVEGRGPLTFRVFDWLLHWFKAVLFKSWVEVEGN